MLHPTECFFLPIYLIDEHFVLWKRKSKVWWKWIKNEVNSETRPRLWSTTTLVESGALTSGGNGVDLLLSWVNSGQMRWFMNHIRMLYLGGRFGKCSPWEIPVLILNREYYSIYVYVYACIINHISLFIAISFSFRYKNILFSLG